MPASLGLLLRPEHGSALHEPIAQHGAGALHRAIIQEAARRPRLEAVLLPRSARAPLLRPRTAHLLVEHAALLHLWPLLPHLGGCHPSLSLHHYAHTSGKQQSTIQTAESRSVVKCDLAGDPHLAPWRIASLLAIHSTQCSNVVAEPVSDEVGNV